MRPPTEKRPAGWFFGRHTKLVKTEFDDGHYRPYGPRRSHAFAKKSVICMLYTTDVGGLRMRRVGLKTLAQQVARPSQNPQWALTFNKWGKITLAYHVYHP